MPIRYLPMDSAIAHALRTGGLDAYGLVPERAISDGDGVPCRHCLGDIPAGKPVMVLAYRPFATVQPYAETGPIFLCKEECAAHDPAQGMPESFRSRARFQIRCYDGRDRMIYDLNGMVEIAELDARAEALFEAHPHLAYIHLRSETAGCYRARIERG